MNGKPFLDTNVLVYAFSTSDRRGETAKKLLAQGGVVSVQVLNEFVNVSRGKLRRDWDAIGQSLQAMREFLDAPASLTDETHRLAFDLSRRYGFAIYDSLILSAARLAGCGIVYTEDFQHGQVVEGVLVQNPFLDA